MIEAVYRIGRLADQYLTGRSIEYAEKHVIFIMVKISDEGVSLANPVLYSEDFDPDKVKRYLYDKNEGGANTPAIMPNLNFNKPQSAIKKIIGWLKKGRNKLGSKIAEVIDEKKDVIINELENKRDEFPKEQVRLSIKIVDDSGEKYVGDIDEFVKLAEWIRGAKTAGASKQGQCALCLQTKNNIVDEASGVFRFYTVDKDGYIAGGLNKKQAWKTFPVCAECYEVLGKGKDIVENFLKFKFQSGVSYYVVPEIVSSAINSSEQELQEVLDIVTDTEKRITITDRYDKILTDNEDEILEYLGDKSSLVYHLLFLHKSQSAERIVLLVEDVPPSRIRELFKARREVDNIIPDRNKRPYTLYELIAFFKKDTGKTDYEKKRLLFELIDAIFKSKQVNKNILLREFMQKIRTDILNKGEPDSRFIRYALRNVLFFEKIGLIVFNHENKGMMSGSFDKYFERFGSVFSSSVSKGVFLLGALTRFLIEEQKRDRGSTPFLKKLKSFKMKQQDFLGLIPEIENKLRAYEAGSKFSTALKEEAIKQLLLAGKDWQESIDELNFFFVAGMNLYWDLKEFYNKTQETEDV